MKEYKLARLIEDEFGEFRDIYLNSANIRTDYEMNYDAYDLGYIHSSAIDNYESHIDNNYYYGIVNSEELLIGVINIQNASPLGEISHINLTLSVQEGESNLKTAMKLVFEELKERGVLKMFCSIRGTDSISKKFLELIGFELEGNLRMAIWTENEIFDELVYGHKLVNH